MNEDPKVVSEKVILKAKLFDVKELEIERLGKKVIHLVADRHPTVSVFPLTDKNELYLVSQYRYLLKERTLEAMAGFINENEEPLTAAKRELEEETGLVASGWTNLGEIQLSASVFKAESTLYLAKNLTQHEQKQDEGEDIAVVKMKLEDILEKVLNGEINHSATVIGILLLDKMMRKGDL